MILLTAIDTSRMVCLGCFKGAEMVFKGGFQLFQPYSVHGVLDPQQQGGGWGEN